MNDHASARHNNEECEPEVLLDIEFPMEEHKRLDIRRIAEAIRLWGRFEGSSNEIADQIF